jgi:hypothetical protein
MECNILVKVKVDGNVSLDDALEFIKGELGYGFGMSLSNPLIDEDSGAEIEIMDVDIF